MRFGIFAMTRSPFHCVKSLFVRREFEVTSPFTLLWRSDDDGQIGFLHLPALEQIRKRLDRAKTFRKKQNAARIRVEAVNVAEKFQPARARPKISGGDG